MLQTELVGCERFGHLCGRHGLLVALWEMEDLLFLEIQVKFLLLWISTFIFWKAAPISVLGAFGTSCKHLPLLCSQTAVHRPIFTFSSISLSALVFIQLPRGVPGSLADKWSQSVHQLADNFVCPPFGAEKVENDQFILFYFGGAENVPWCWK